MWKIAVGTVVRTGQTTYMPVKVVNGRTTEMRSVCYTYAKAEKIVRDLNGPKI